MNKDLRNARCRKPEPESNFGRHKSFFCLKNLFHKLMCFVVINAVGKSVKGQFIEEQLISAKV